MVRLLLRLIDKRHVTPLHVALLDKETSRPYLSSCKFPGAHCIVPKLHPRFQRLSSLDNTTRCQLATRRHGCGLGRGEPLPLLSRPADIAPAARTRHEVGILRGQRVETEARNGIGPPARRKH